MRILQLHSDFIEYELISKEISIAEEAKVEKVRYEDIVVLFVSVEEGDSESSAKRGIDEVKVSLERLKAKRIIIYPYSHLSNKLADPSVALKMIRVMEQHAKEMGLEVYRAPFGWNKAFNIKIKGHPLAEQSKVITSSDVTSEQESVSQALKAEEKIRSTWHILEPDGTMTPIDRFEFTRHKNLDRLVKYEINKVRTVQVVPPHVILMKRLGFVDYEPGSDPGNLRFYPKGRLIKSLLEQYVTQMVREYGGIEVETPIMYDFRHPSLADYLNRFPARQYVLKSEDRDLFLRFSACFGQFLMVKDAQISYRQLPLRIYELTRYSFRREKSGELVGLRRLRAFTMPDCHALCADLEQVKEELPIRFQLSIDVLKGIGLVKDDYELAIRSTEEFYRENSQHILSLVKMMGKPALLEMWSDRFFYFSFKWEFNFIDNLDKASALSTDQIDVENAERYGITYVDYNGVRRHPIILHNSPSGAIERCIYALLEKAYILQKQGDVPRLPLWLAPTQVRIIPFTQNHTQGAMELAEFFEKNQVRVDIDDREESVQKKIRDAEREWVRYILVFGEKEVSSKLLQARDRETRSIKSLTSQELLDQIISEIRGKPFIPLPLPKMISQRPVFAS